MDPDLTKFIEKNIQSLLMNDSHSQENMFDRFVEVCKSYYDQPAHNFAEMRMKMNKKLRGDIFEHFCVKYLTVCKKFDNVWLLADVPEEVLKKLRLKRNDMGIDIICKDNKNRYYAVQAKYRKRNQYKTVNVLGWKSLSTFYAIVYRCGPFYKHIIMTTANYVRHANSTKDKKDWSMCLKTFQNIKNIDWLKMTGSKGCSLIEEKSDKEEDEVEERKEVVKVGLTMEEVREKRLKLFDKKAKEIIL